LAAEALHHANGRRGILLLRRRSGQRGQHAINSKTLRKPAQRLIMTPKEKAVELIEKMLLSHPASYNGANIGYAEAKQCALIAVDEIIEVAYWESVKYYWQEVKQEIKKL